MLKGINYWAFPADAKGALLTGIEVLDRAVELGFDAVEFTVDPVGAVTPETTQKEVEQLRNEAAKRNIILRTLAAGLAWGASPSSPDPKVRAQAVENAKKQLRLASWLGCSSILYLPGMVSACFVPEFSPQPYDKVLQWSKESLSAILPLAEELKIGIGVENVWNRFLLSPVEMAEYIDSFSSEYVGSYFDVGNVMLYGHPEHWIRILGKRILAVHMKDFRVNVGNLDGFVDLLAGDVCFPEVMKAFKEVGYNGTFTAEYVPGTLGATEKAAVALKIIEKM
ncbi:MAG: sugar phosphate isomerase/epimerase [Sphaerochaetaceae bacterium]|jgi:hexulose-6-phosphate isomerase|nr:sugar phosphate isomerase/epimerase [Sphaerochaetaceae bacterium]MDD4218582.1 sugar phosphate isomerase/epimerase [Sphaerochaetaceae bacterium]